MSMVIFSLMRLAPGNIVDIIFESAGYVDQADKRQLEHELGVDRPIPAQYVRWVGELVQGDLGKSYRYDMRVAHHQAPAAGDAGAGGPRAAVLHPPRRAVRRHQRSAPEPSDRLRAARRFPGRPLDAVLLARHGGDPRPGAVARLDPVRHLRLAARRPAGQPLAVRRPGA